MKDDDYQKCVEDDFDKVFEEELKVVNVGNDDADVDDEVEENVEEDENDDFDDCRFQDCNSKCCWFLTKYCQFQEKMLAHARYLREEQSV